jgi:hypothetical protein
MSEDELRIYVFGHRQGATAGSVIAPIAAELSFSPTALGFTAANIQAAIEEAVRSLVPLPLAGTAHDVAASHAGRGVQFTNAAAVSYTVQPQASVPVPNGRIIPFFQLGVGQVEVIQGAGVNVRVRPGRLRRLAGENASGALWHLDGDNWLLYGDLEAAP